MSPALWLLDVDGVVNAVSTFPKKSVWKDFTKVQVAKMPIWYSPTVVEFINDANRSGRAQVAWLTTWGEQARAELSPALGLDDFPVWSTESASSGQHGWWKLEAAKRCPTDRRLVWTDDDLRVERLSWEWVGTRADTLALSPWEHTGLDAGDLSRIDRFLRGDKQP